MKLIYTHPNLAIVVQVASVLEHSAIACEVRNEYASGAIGELAPINAWPEVWVVREQDATKAMEVVENMQQPVDSPDWSCRRCESNNPATFDICWHCGAEMYYESTPIK